MLLTKPNITLQVHCGGKELSVTPIVSDPEREKLLSVIARNEKLLAQVFFGAADFYYLKTELKDYFAYRSRQVVDDRPGP